MGGEAKSWKKSRVVRPSALSRRPLPDSSEVRAMGTVDQHLAADGLENLLRLDVRQIRC
jgi:hypothetical protein